MFVPNFKILGQVVSEKSLTEKKFTDRHTDTQTSAVRTEKAKTVYPLYTSYTGGINIKRIGFRGEVVENVDKGRRDDGYLYIYYKNF